MGLLERIEAHASRHPDQPFARPRPLCWAFCTWSVGSTIMLMPVWAVWYSVLPRPRKGWTLRETLVLRFMRNMNHMSEQAGLSHSVRDPTLPPKRRPKETRFEWKQALAPEYRRGVIDDPEVPFMDRVGTFIWSKQPARSNDEEVAQSTDGLVGVYFHGGGYCHFNASEHSQTSSKLHRDPQLRTR